MHSIEELMTYETPRHPAMPWLAAAEFVDAEDRQYACAWLTGSGGMGAITDSQLVLVPPSIDMVTP
ncbi:hypothetical protein AAKU55_005269 [Oxalobacteraceae bacterium GrIS 1.11]